MTKPLAKPELQRLLDLQAFLHQFNLIERVVHHPDSKIKLETDTEHTYSLAMAGWFLAQYFKELDRDLVIKYALVHDLVEVYAGDTYIYADQTVLDSKAEREQKALVQIKQEWPDFPEMTGLIDAYEHKADEESKFVYALDKIMPILMIFLGEGYTWKQEKISLQQLLDKKADKVAMSPEINEYYQKLVGLLQQHQHYFTDK